MTSQINSLILLIAVVWAMIFVGLTGIFLVVVPIPDFISGYFGSFVTSAIQLLISGALVMIWLFSFWQLRNYYVRKKILNPSEKK